VAVLGIPSKIFGEEIIAFIEKKDDLLLEEEVFNICSEYLQVIKRPSKVFFVDFMMVGPSGKILKKKMKEQLMEKLGI